MLCLCHANRIQSIVLRTFVADPHTDSADLWVFGIVLEKSKLQAHPSLPLLQRVVSPDTEFSSKDSPSDVQSPSPLLERSSHAPLPMQDRAEEVENGRISFPSLSWQRFVNIPESKILSADDPYELASDPTSVFALFGEALQMRVLRWSVLCLIFDR